MKRLLSTAAVAVLVAGSVPALAQTGVPSSGNPPAAVSGASTPQSQTPMKGTAKKLRPHAKAPVPAKRESASDNSADQLNRQELDRIQQGRSPDNG